MRYGIVAATWLLLCACGTESSDPAVVGTSSGGVDTTSTSPSSSTTGTSSSTSAVGDTSSGSETTDASPDLPPPSGPDGVICVDETCPPGDACNICNEDGSTSCVPPSGGDICLDGWTLRCDGPEDCEAGQHCVFNVTQLGNMVGCADEDTFVVCDATPQIVCHDDQDCPSGCQYCVASEDPTAPVSFCRVMS